MIFRFICITILLTSIAFAQSPNDKVLVLANSNVPKSVELAEYYMQQRSIPAENLITLDLPQSETISWDQFLDSTFNPLRKRLVEQEWVNGNLSSVDRKDNKGRLAGSFYGHKIACLVVVKGVPLRIKNDPTKVEAEKSENIPKHLSKNYGSVDSELSLLLAPEQAPTIALVPNPLFQKKEPSMQELASVVRVARLDGRTWADARRLIDNAIAGEKYGLRGRAYVDKGGPHKQGNDWLDSNIEQIKTLGFDLSTNDEKELINETERFDAPAIYFGWWTYAPEGAAALDEVQFPPGAIGIHIHSFSAATISGKSIRWTSELVRMGMTGTVGNTYEPYLQATHHTPLFLEALMDGKSLLEAGYYALPVLSWQAILVGDPLYKPFSVSLKQQLERIETGETTPLDAYVIIRKMNLLEKEKGKDEALALGKQYLYKLPSMALALKVARLQADDGDGEAALRTLAFIPKLSSFKPQQMALAVAATDFFIRHGGAEGQKEATAIWQALLDHSAVTEYQERKWLSQAARTAERANETELANQWRTRLNIVEEKHRQRLDAEAKAKAEAQAKK